MKLVRHVMELVAKMENIVVKTSVLQQKVQIVAFMIAVLVIESVAVYSWENVVIQTCIAALLILGNIAVLASVCK